MPPPKDFLKLRSWTITTKSYSNNHRLLLATSTQLVYTEFWITTNFLLLFISVLHYYHTRSYHDALLCNRSICYSMCLWTNFGMLILLVLCTVNATPCRQAAEVMNQCYIYIYIEVVKQHIILSYRKLPLQHRKWLCWSFVCIGRMFIYYNYIPNSSLNRWQFSK